MNIGKKEADSELARVEQELKREYAQAAREMQEKADKFLEGFRKRDEKKRIDLARGKITQDQYDRWRAGQLATDKQMRTLQSILAQDCVNANKIAMKIINNSRADVYAMSANYGAYKIERETGINTSFVLYNHTAVENLIKTNDDFLPKAKVDIPKDRRWNQQKIKSALVQGVLQGDGAKDVAKRLQSVADMNEHTAMRTARTMNTAIMNKAHLDEAHRAQELGIAIEKVWTATLDNVTRDSHVDVDGEHQPLDKKFSNGLMYPGDTSGPPEEFYNCRCDLDYDYPKYRNRNWQRNTDKMTQEDYDTWKKERGTGKRTVTDNNTKTFAENIAALRVAMQQANNPNAEEFIYKAGEMMQEEYHKEYDPKIKELDEAEAAVKEFDNEMTKLQKEKSTASAVMRGLLTEEEAGFSKEYANQLCDIINEKMLNLQTSKEYSDAYSRLRTVRNALNDQSKHMKWLKDKIGETRNMGTDGMDYDVHFHFNSGYGGQAGQAVRAAYSYYPTEWVQKSIEYNRINTRAVSRGYYRHHDKDGASKIAISGDGDHALATAVHELGHRYERVIPGIIDDERAFYKKRTEGEELEWLGAGYGRNERSRKDDFVNAYMGKDYGGSAFELVSMGFQYAYTDPTRLAKDPDMQKWIYGILLMR